jgi:tellurite resistance protein
MIIFGTRGVTYNHAEGRFHCPRCSSEQGYHHKRVRRFFTLYFIPLIPLDLLGEYADCDKCRSTWNLEVLAFNPAADKKAFEAEFERAVKRVMVMMMLADGNVEASEVERIREVYEQLADVKLSEADVHAEADKARAEKLSLDQFLQSVAARLNDQGKELVVKAAMMVAASDGNLADEELKLLTDIGRALGMTPAHLKGVLQQQAA